MKINPQGKEVTAEHAERCISRARTSKEIILPSDASIDIDLPALNACIEECNGSGYSITFGKVPPNKTKCLAQGMDAAAVDKMPDATVAVFTITDHEGQELAYFEDIFWCPPFCNGDTDLYVE
ncbi:MAG: hypothetical protein HEP71_34295 [Roseivirga sp.]|nr:hypothetical protein [Roseivirga sp.]